MRSIAIDIVKKDKSKNSKLRASSEKGNIDAVKLLLDAGADVNAQDNKYYTALMYATSYNHKEIVWNVGAFGSCRDLLIAIKKEEKNDNEINIEERIIVEEIMPIDPNEFNSDYVIKWNDKKKVLIYIQKI